MIIEVEACKPPPHEQPPVNEQLPVSEQPPANEQPLSEVRDEELSEPEPIDEEEEDTLVAVGPGKFWYGRCGVSLEFGKYYCRECYQAFVGPPGMEDLKNHIRQDHRGKSISRKYCN